MEHYPIGKQIKETIHGTTIKITEVYFDGVYCVRLVQHGRHYPYTVVLKNGAPISNGTDNTDQRLHVLVPDDDGCIRNKKIYY
jgi:hypothetical protein